ncbi:hypothetical protein ACQ4PT_067249 [Festuca glaucescens]
MSAMLTACHGDQVLVPCCRRAVVSSIGVVGLLRWDCCGDHGSTLFKNPVCCFLEIIQSSAQPPGEVSVALVSSFRFLSPLFSKTPAINQFLQLISLPEPSMTPDTIRTVIGIIGNGTALMLYLSPVPTFYSIWKKKTVEQYSAVPYLATLLNCMIWLFYGLPVVQPHSMLIITINGIGLVIELTYIAIFLAYSVGAARRRVHGRRHPLRHRRHRHVRCAAPPIRRRCEGDHRPLL